MIGDKIANSAAQPAATQQRCTEMPPHRWVTTCTYAGRKFTEVAPWAAQPGQAFGVSVHTNASGSSTPPVPSVVPR